MVRRMLNWSKLLVFVPVTIILVVTPGPNTLYIIARGLHGGYRAGLISCLWVLLATLIHLAGVAVGLTVLLSSSALVFSIIKYTGAAYLIVDWFKDPRDEATRRINISYAAAESRRSFLSGVSGQSLESENRFILFGVPPTIRGLLSGTSYAATDSVGHDSGLFWHNE